MLSFLLIGFEDRVTPARERALPVLQKAFKAAQIPYPPKEIYFRAFKKEAELELWATGKAGGPMKRVMVWPVARQSGTLGPKRREGDLQVPEGFYHIDRFNPRSRFHLSLGINYPNASDRIRGSNPLGGDVFIHGARVSIGCLAMTDPLIEQIYTVADAVRGRIRADFFPMRKIQFREAPNDETKVLWMELRQGLRRFEKTRRPPAFRVEADGSYRVI